MYSNKQQEIPTVLCGFFGIRDNGGGMGFCPLLSLNDRGVFGVEF